MSTNRSIAEKLLQKTHSSAYCDFFRIKQGVSEPSGFY